jgi:hypothetical protein
MAKTANTAPTTDGLEAKMNSGINLRKAIAMGGERPTSTPSGGQGARSGKGD